MIASQRGIQKHKLHIPKICPTQILSTNLINVPTGQSPYWEALSPSVSQRILSLLWNPHIYFHIYKILLLAQSGESNWYNHNQKIQLRFNIIFLYTLKYSKYFSCIFLGYSLVFTYISPIFKYHNFYNTKSVSSRIARSNSILFMKVTKTAYIFVTNYYFLVGIILY